MGPVPRPGTNAQAAAGLLSEVIGSIQIRSASAPSGVRAALPLKPRSAILEPGPCRRVRHAVAHSADLLADEGSPGRDPNVTFLDDDSITYKDLEHGAFELVTKEAVPRHILVEDPGQTIVLRPQGSSVSVNQVTNSPARMAELQEAQQEVLANATKGLGPTGSSTPPSVNSLPVQPINFIQNDSTQPAQNARTAAGELRHGPRDHHRTSAAAGTDAADVQCSDRADRNRHRGV